MKNSFSILFLVCSLFGLGGLSGCEENENQLPTPEQLEIRGVDISSLPEIEQEGTLFYNQNGQVGDMLDILKEAGVNTIRLRLWHTPQNEHSSFAEVADFAKRGRQKGLKIWLTVHYSDTWADPGNQQTPQAWQALSFSQLKDSVYAYTSKIVRIIKPEYIQVGNETNPGMLLPQGNINSQPAQFIALLEEGIRAVRTEGSQAQIIIHHAGTSGASVYYEKLKSLDYDIMGLSYYPIWHGKELSKVQQDLTGLSNRFGKKILLAETAYPFTLGWNDWTDNVLGDNSQIITPDYPATEQGQKAFMEQIDQMMVAVPNGIGFGYWGAELVSFRGPQSKEGSAWENQALFGFHNKLLPAIEAFRKK